jgi:hypothetical protein
MMIYIMELLIVFFWHVWIKIKQGSLWERGAWRTDKMKWLLWRAWLYWTMMINDFLRYYERCGVVMATVFVYQFVGTPSAECCRKRNFPRRVTWGFISNSRENWPRSWLHLSPLLATRKIKILSCVRNSTVWFKHNEILVIRNRSNK